MKYLEEARNSIKSIMRKFVENEPEDTEEYDQLYEIKRNLDRIIDKKFADKLKKLIQTEAAK